MATDDFDFDDFDFDDLDFDIPDIDAPNEDDSRNPVVAVATSFGKGVASGIISTDQLEETLRRALPEGYSLALNTKDSVQAAAGELYRDAAKELAPAITGIKTTTRTLLPKVKGKIPGWLERKLESLSESDDPGTGTSITGANEDAIASQLAEIFKTQVKAEAEQRDEDKTQELVRDRVEDKRFNTQQGTLGVIARGMDRLVSFQDGVGIEVSRKSLELQIRQLALLQQIGTRIEVDNATKIAELKSITKNTALPEIQKIQASEIAKKTLGESLAGAAISPIANFGATLISGVTSNVKGMYKGVLGGGGQLGMAKDMLLDATADMTPAQRNAFLAEQAGAGIGGMLRDELALRAAPMLERIPAIAKFGNRLRSNLIDLPAMIDSWAKSETTRSGLLGVGEQFLKDLTPKYYQDESLGADTLTGSDIATYYDEQSRRSLVEVIPGLLTSINRWTRMSATGEDYGDDDMPVYNHVRGGFTTKKSMLKDVSERIVSRHVRKSVQDNLAGLITELGAESVLSPEAVAGLRRQLLMDAGRNEPFNPARLAQVETYQAVTSDAVREELAEFFRDRFSLGHDGKPLGEVDTKLLGDVRSKMKDLKMTLPSPDASIRALSRVVGKDTIKSLGFIRREGLVDKIDLGKMYDRLLEDPEEEQLAQTKSVRAGAPNSLRDAKARGEAEERIRQLIPGWHSPYNAPVQSTETKTVCCDEDSPLYTVVAGIRSDMGRQADAQLDVLTRLLAIQAGALPGDVDVNRVMPEYGAGWRGALHRGIDSGIAAAGWAGDKILTGGKRYFGLIRSLYGGAFNLVREVGTMGVDRVKGMFQGDGIRDVYVKGESQPRLLATRLRQGLYHDAETLETIHSFADINGPVLNDDGTYALTQEDVDAGLLDGKGRSILSNLMGKAATVGRLGLTAIAAPYALAWKGVAKGLELIDKVTRTVKDAYYPGEENPRILARLLRKGNHYWDVGSQAFISSLEEITGEIRIGGPNGDVILTEEELRQIKGLVDSAGELIKLRLEGVKASAIGGAKKLGEAAWGLAKGYGKVVLGLYKGAFNLLRRGSRWLSGKVKGAEVNLTGEFQTDMVRIGHAQLTVQQQILKLLGDWVGTQIQDVHDKTGDGHRDGSWQAKKAEDKEAANSPSAHLKEMARNGVTWGGIGAAAASGAGWVRDKIRGKGDPDKEDDQSGDTSIGDMAAAGGLGAAAWGATKTGGKYLGKAAWGATKFVGKRMLWPMLKFAGTIVGAKAILIGAAIAGVVYGGYKLYEYHSRKVKPLMELRMAQYGVNFFRKKPAARTLEIEKLLLKYVRANGDEYVLDPKRLPMRELLRVSGIDPNVDTEENREAVKNLVIWITDRFTPVFVKHLNALRPFNVMLHEADDRLTPTQALEVLNAVRLAELDDVFNDIDVATPEIKLTMDAGDVEKFYKKGIKHYTELKAKSPEEEEGAPEESGITAALKSGLQYTPLGFFMNKPGEKLGFGTRLLRAMSPIHRLKAVYQPLMNAWTGLKNWVTGDKLGSLEEKYRHLFSRDGKLTKPAQIAQLVRYYASGMMADEAEQYQSLRALDILAAPHIEFEGKRAVWKGDVQDVLSRVGWRFGELSNHSQAQADWIGWFNTRYLPVLLEYATAVRALYATDVMEAVNRLRAGELLEVLEKAIAAKDPDGVSVWKIDTTPWPGRPVNQQASSVKTLLDALRQAAKQDKIPNPAIGAGSQGQLGAQRSLQGPNASAPPGRPLARHPGNGSQGDVNNIPMAQGQGWNSVKDTVVSAAEMVGVDPTLLALTAGVESSFNPTAAAPNTNARGLYQFVPGTWDEQLEKHGAKYGLSANASPMDPRASSLMAAVYYKENIEAAQKKFPDREITDIDAYLMHLLGRTGGMRVIGADPSDPLAKHTSAVARKNNNLDKLRTVGDLYAHIEGKFSQHRQVIDVNSQSSYAGLQPGPNQVVANPPSEALAYDAPDAGTPYPQPLSAMRETYGVIATGGNADKDDAAELGGESPQRGNELADGSNASTYLDLNGQRIDGLNPQMRQLFLGMVEEYGSLTGKVVKLNAGYRSYEEQAYLRRKYGAKAAPPGRSLHEFGLALDIDRGVLSEMERLGLLRKYGFTRPVGQEPWHLEPVGIQPDLDRARQDPAWATTRVAMGQGRGGGGYGTLASAKKYSRNPAMLGGQLEGIDTATAVASNTSDETPSAMPVSMTAPSMHRNAPTTPEQRAMLHDTQARGMQQPVTVDLGEVETLLGQSVELQSGMHDRLKEAVVLLQGILERPDPMIQVPDVSPSGAKPQVASSRPAISSQRRLS